MPGVNESKEFVPKEPDVPVLPERVSENEGLVKRSWADRVVQ